MKIFASGLFIEEVKKLIKSGSHADCEIVLIEEIFSKKLKSITQRGTPKKIGGANETPFIRRRLNDGSGSSGGYRLYLWAFVVDKQIYLLFIHPKTGRRSGSNIDKNFQKALVKTFLKEKKSGGLIQLSLNKRKEQIIYSSDKKSVFS